MTILNSTTDGLYPELISIFRAVAHSGSLDRTAVIDLCSRGIQGDSARLRSVLKRWTDLGLFEMSAESIQIAEQFGKKKRGESIDEITNRLPTACRTLMLNAKNCIPLWGESPGISADFVRGTAWLLAQDIYELPKVWVGGAEDLHNVQIAADMKIIENDTRWNPLRYWMRYLGFATGDGTAFQIDPTIAIKAELPTIFKDRPDLSAHDFITALASRLPVLDFGQYRLLVEDILSKECWRQPDNIHLSMSLSLALRRLDLDNVIHLTGQADAGTSYRLTGRNYRSWIGFESVRWIGGQL